jgi:hypothetical protein
MFFISLFCFTFLKLLIFVRNQRNSAIRNACLIATKIRSKLEGGKRYHIFLFLLCSSMISLN